MGILKLNRLPDCQGTFSQQLGGFANLHNAAAELTLRCVNIDDSC